MLKRRKRRTPLAIYEMASSDRVRYMTQVTYARRIIGHKYYPFMNYIMPKHVYEDADERLRRLLGFLPRGAYG
jgi:hypothetical protein